MKCRLPGSAIVRKIERPGADSDGHLNQAYPQSGFGSNEVSGRTVLTLRLLVFRGRNPGARL